MRILLQLLVAVATSLALTAQARPNFNYLGVGYVAQRIDGGCNQSGVVLDASLVTNELWFVQARHVDVTSSTWCGSTSTQAGIGARLDLGRLSRVYAIASAVRRDYGPQVDWGMAAAAGLRTIIAPRLEAHVYINQELLDKVDQTYAGAEVNHWLTRDFSVQAGGSVSNEKTRSFHLGVRLNF